MAGNTIGTLFKLTTFGESHGTSIGGIIDGCPPSISLDLEAIQKDLDRRKPGQSAIVTQRKESDTVKFLSGIFEGKTTGTPIGFVIENENQKSKDYSHIKDSFRPSHADYVYQQKYGIRDYRGGGRSSARETACRVVAGAVAKQVISSIKIYAFTSSVGDLFIDKPYQDLDFSKIDANDVRCPDSTTAEKMIEKNIRTNNEFYIAPVYNEMIRDGEKILHYPIAEMRGLGTPEDLSRFLENINKNKPSVILIAGVNGVGKTTTIGKLGKILGQNNKKIVLGAADTFRAAAVSQLEVWAKRINADIIKSEEGADPASVAYKALDHAKKNNFDYLLIDTAGRLQNKKNLMDEFKKITKVLKKIDSNAPHETFLILDATTGQSAISQVEEFKKISPITGIIMTKLDGTAKGGILLAIGKKFKLPIIALGMGEKEDDLQTFNSEYFSNALMQF